MKVTAFIGSESKKYTYGATEKLLQKLQSFGEVEYELVRLSDYKIGICRGCKLCLDKGEEKCPLKDDRDKLVEKIKKSDGVVFASPNYSFQVSAYMKIFLDRFGYFFHRPQFFGKTFTSIVTQGVYGGNKIVKYFNFIGKALGFNLVKGSCLLTREPMTEKGRQKIDRILEKQAKKFYAQVMKKEFPTPSFFDLMIFRLSRTSMKIELNKEFRDYNYYSEKGWFKSDFFYPVKLNPLKKISGKLFDKLAVRISGN